MYLQDPLTKTQGESSHSRYDEYAKVPSLVKLQGVNLPNAWVRGTSMVEVLVNP